MARRAKPSKGQAGAKRPPASKSPKNEGSKLRDLQKRLAEAQEQQTATAEILRVISGSSTDEKPVFDAVAESAARLCGAFDASIFRVDGDRLAFVAHHGPIAQRHGDFSLPLVRGTVGGRSVLESRTVQVADVQNEAREFPDAVENAQRFGFRTILSVPLLREGIAIGGIQLRRTEVQLFSERQVTLLQIFADQAVIAIENVRLFKELEARNTALTDSLEQQTATSEILRVISSSPTDAQTVFDTIVETAARLCDAEFSAVARFDGGQLHLVSMNRVSPEEGEAWHRLFPRRPERGFVMGRAVVDTRATHVEDVLADPDYDVRTHETTLRLTGYRTFLGIPIMKDNVPLGVLGCGRRRVKPFTAPQIALVKTFADQAVIAIENVRLFNETKDALERQTATSDILRVIAGSPTDVQPVFATIMKNALRLCSAQTAAVLTFDGHFIHAGAFLNIPADAEEQMRRLFPRVPDRSSAAGRAILTGDVAEIPDVEADPDYVFASAVRAGGLCSNTAVPMLRDGRAIGTINLGRTVAGRFAEGEIALLKTFADQAVIAIENVRLFKELDARNREVSWALDRQTATGEILRVIASSPTDVQPVFDAIVESARRLLGGRSAAVMRRIEDEIHLGAFTLTDEEGNEDMRSSFPISIDMQAKRNPVAARVFTDGDIEHISDRESDPRLLEGTRVLARRRGWRSRLIVPMRCDGGVVGAIAVTRSESGPFSDDEIALLQTFADQAVIAIENVRLFTELQASNQELTTALDKQTATSEILRVISQSQTDVRPVFEAIVSSAIRLMRAEAGALTLVKGDQLELAAFTGTNVSGEAAIKAAFPLSLKTEGSHANAIRDRAPVNIADAQTGPQVGPIGRSIAAAGGYRSMVAVPMLRQDVAIGTIAATRREVGGFTGDEIALLRTFADQAVIAIENVRLFKELEARTQDLTRSVGELRALSEVGQAISSTLDLETVLTTIVSRAVQLSGLDGGVVFEYDDNAEEFIHRVATEGGGVLAAARRATRVRKGEGVVGQTAIAREPAQVQDIAVPGAYESRLRENLIESGVRAILAVPMVREGELIGCLVVSRNTPGEFPTETIDLLRTFATQSALAIQNARLFREIEIKSRQLEVASQHKSEFLANMSHELRTPLNAIIGFSEVLTDRMFGELNEKQEEYLKDIYSSGTHLLSLINDILDLSKIEAGRMELELTDFHLPTALDNALTLVRERAGRRSITLQMSVDDRLGQIRADERKIRQVVLNLLSNAIKFTPEGGRIEVGAVPRDGFMEVSVSDTGIGIAPEDQEKVFEEFRQVGTAAKKVEGTGLGLTLCRKFVELHGGRIGVKSRVGVGSTFTFTIPCVGGMRAHAE